MSSYRIDNHIGTTYRVTNIGYIGTSTRCAENSPRDHDTNPTQDRGRLAAIRRSASVLRDAPFCMANAGLRRIPALVAWPNVLAGEAISWLASGRAADRVPPMLFAILRVRGGEWFSPQSALGPLDPGLVRMTDGAVLDRRPDDLACALLELMDDMGLLAAGAADDEALCVSTHPEIHLAANRRFK